MKPSIQQPNPWVSRVAFDALQTRAAEAEACLRDVLNVIDPELLIVHLGDWKAATRALTGADET